ncbi:hypothetical protein G6F40_015856 [Rhizopus arrhizus]|nr:hypothetical protein G6F40_015856 [Rhizopus arrhizus]
MSGLRCDTLRGRAGRDAVRHRPFRCGQEHPAQVAPPRRAAQPWRGGVRRAQPAEGAWRRCAAPPTRGGGGLPGPSPADGPLDRRERGAAADPARYPPRRHQQARALGARTDGPGPSREGAALAAVGRRAAARRHRPRHRRRAQTAGG